jgi:hypothetical protein
MIRVYKFKAPINSNFSGFKQLMNFFTFCKDFTKETISIDFYHCDFFEANMCAILEALIYKLENENKLKFTADFVYLKEKFDVFFRSGFLKEKDNVVEDIQGTTLPFETFTYEDAEKDRFCDYVTEKLMIHQGIPTLSEELKDIIIDDLIEIYSNSAFHANSTDPFFVAGQYYPKLKELQFTMVDLGQGFLPKIELATNSKVSTDIDAIKWATANSSKMASDKVPGGLGIKGILKYCKNNNGVLKIASGNGFWASDFDGTIFSEGRISDEAFSGAIINLTFRK